MSCGLIDVPCHIWSVIAPFWFWMQVGFWVVVAAGALWALSKIKDIAGWPGVATVAGIGIYLFGHMRGRSGKPIIPDFDGGNVTGKDAQPSVRQSKRALTAGEVRELQAALNALGHDAGEVDGRPGRQTKEAIRQYQASRDEAATGILTAPQLAALRRVLRGRK